MTKEDYSDELKPDDLDSVAGGTCLGELFQKVILQDGTVNAAEKDLMPSAVTEQGVDSLPGEPGEKTAIAFCEVCRRETTFRIRSGGRAYCKICNTYKPM